MYADTYTVRLLGWFRARTVEETGERLFQPPAEVAGRRDTIDEAIEADRAHLSPAKRIALGTLGVLSASGAPSIGGGQHEIVKIWGGADQFVGGDKGR